MTDPTPERVPVEWVVVHAFDHMQADGAVSSGHISRLIEENIATAEEAGRYVYGFTRLAAAVAHAVGRRNVGFSMADGDFEEGTVEYRAASTALQMLSAHSARDSKLAFALVLPWVQHAPKDEWSDLIAATTMIVGHFLNTLDPVQVAAINPRDLKRFGAGK